ncbi:Morn repeat incomplete domain containing protein [Pandoravirus quercus]|uniref:Morn repeat incomplete domain containing protein n=1 Tax=Pandoravirus quercus TaxID=2107709 RepID=A0A2U7U9D9_9VIRU|nr:Morn repeat incomplete domain containing protein [Pandoravirus quercus]AVK75061.1 Morn repeat incomplete domain containing protein [Pandoravirus quercus]
MDDNSLITSLPVELVWSIVDTLLDKIGSVFDVGRLALTSTTMAALLVDDRAWQARCQRRFGRARTSAHNHNERFGIRWVRLYVSMANDLTPPKGDDRDSTPTRALCSPRRTWGTLCLQDLVYWGQIIDDRPCGYGVYVTCDSSGHTLVTEAALDDSGRRCGWISVTRTNRYYGMRHAPRHDEPETHCVCHICLRQYPGLSSRLGGMIAAYVGDWDGGRIQGHGRAEFTNGLVYDGQWADGVPHGNGTLDGKPYRWHHGLPVSSGQWVGLEHTTADDGDWTYEGDVLVGTSDTDDDTVCRWCWMMCVQPDDYNVATFGGTPLGDYGPVPHGHGRATHRDGRVYSGTWRLGARERGHCMLPDGTRLEGVWRVRLPTQHRGAGWVTAPGAASRAMATWGRNDEPCHDTDARGPTYAHAEVHVTLLAGHRSSGMSTGSGGGPDCAYPNNGIQRRPLIITYGNGDTCAIMCNSSERVCGVVRFNCSTYCPDPEFAGLVITSESGWSPIPFCHERYVSAIYWPTDPASDAFARFAAYVRQGYIGWTPAQVDAFWVAMADLGVAAAQAKSEP